MSEEESGKIHNQLKELYDEGGKWARLATNISGLNIVRMPRHKNRPARLALEINPIIPSVGRPQKKSLFITTEEQLTEYMRIFKSDIIEQIIESIEEINGEAKTQRNNEKFVGKLEFE
jgi:hypothetical protein